ncbi:MAG TPA: SDR family oxidoreductase [Pseudonocardia sp.]|jgi:3-oxoacyl-[acyl-carrier protein] reductase
MISQNGRLAGKAIIVTGSTKGFGAAMVKRFAVEGANVVITGRNEARGREIEQEIQAEGHSAVFLPTDMSEEDSVRAMCAGTVAEFGRIDGLVNNAMAMDQIGSDERAVADMDSAGFDKILKVGIYGVFWACKYAIPEMLKVGGGSIVNISSIAAVAGVPKMPGYSACKGAMGALTRQMAVDYGSAGIRVNTMVSGFVLSSELAAAVDAHPQAGPLMQEAQLTRWGHLDDISAMATYLLSDESGFVTGAEMRIDGGWSSTARIPNLVDMVFAPLAAQQAAAARA